MSIFANVQYKKILDAMPQGVFVFDDKLRVKFTNAAFRRSFSDDAKRKGCFAEVLGCRQNVKCGEGAVCESCAFQKVARAAIESRTEQQQTVHTSVNRGGHTDRISMRIRVLPADEKGKLFFGLDGRGVLFGA